MTAPLPRLLSFLTRLAARSGLARRTARSGPARLAARSGLALAALPLLAGLALGCGPDGEIVDGTRDDGVVLPKRRGTLVIDSCPMDSFHRARLAEPSTRAVIDEVVFLCLFAREDGEVGPAHPETASWLRADIEDTRAAGYRVLLGMTLGESPLDWYSSPRATNLLLDPTWRAGITTKAAAWAQEADGLDLAPPPLENQARAGVTALVDGLAAALPPRTVGLFAPPSLSAPSDLDGGDAFDLPALASRLGRVRVMTLDYSCCAAPGGPSVDAGWAVDAVRFARTQAPGLPLSASISLFGTDFSALGPRSVTYLEATALAAYHGAPIERGPTGVPFLRYQDAAGYGHDLWFDDTFSIKLALGAWATALPADVGVLYYGLGAEDPSLWASLAGSQR
jgi:hypothetical protein